MQLEGTLRGMLEEPLTEVCSAGKQVGQAKPHALLIKPVKPQHQRLVTHGGLLIWRKGGSMETHCPLQVATHITPAGTTTTIII
jgi:hypothetical protein